MTEQTNTPNPSNSRPYRASQSSQRQTGKHSTEQSMIETPITLGEFLDPSPRPRGFYSGQSRSVPRTDTPAVGWHGNAARVFEMRVQSIFGVRTERYTKTSILEDELAALEQMQQQVTELIDMRKRELAALEQTKCSEGLSCSCGRVFETELDFANHFTLTSGPNYKNLGECPVPTTAPRPSRNN